MIWLAVTVLWLAGLAVVLALCKAAARGDEAIARASFGTRIGTKAADQGLVRSRDRIGSGA